MNSSARIAQVIRLAKRREDQAAALLRDWQTKLASAEQQVSQLQQYRQSYMTPANQGHTPQSLANRAQFVAHLSDVIQAQERIAEQLAVKLGHYQQQWRLLHRKRELLEEYGERQALEAMRQLDKLWDRLCDDLASRKYTQPD
ncbi:flagellar export protein FliJ [Simiduia agarivorans]|uniref:Flagellar FliJ protein n=1 Tax=Simiduia agarivorans (strain DSM 21679 / JCM 13881 / BCRC 17597 / SA1) TaxID=1117647 RepID=K4KF71_SIMAS|nr:flagellar export protein FliJ [Simiduia agarivorans]AFU97689.1 putative flagellar protein FliJ [Simiduia agarivorans SA1 = DSM 21679]